MDDDDLDMLLDSVDIVDHVDMDSLLEDVADSVLRGGIDMFEEAETGGRGIYEDDEDIDDLLESHQLAVQLQEWKYATARAPGDLRVKWIKLYENDQIQAVPQSFFRASSHYDGKSERTGHVKKFFQDCVRNALKKVKASEAHITEIMASLLSDPIRHHTLISLFEQELMRVHGSRVKSDPNYEHGRYRNLDVYFSSHDAQY